VCMNMGWLLTNNYPQDTGLKKLIFVEMEEYPGFSESSSPLPQKIESITILKLVTSAIKITEKVWKYLKKSVNLNLNFYVKT